MPTYPYLYGDDLVDVLKKKHAAGTYKSLVSLVCSVLLFNVVICIVKQGLEVYAYSSTFL
jgi:legumain